MNKVVVKKTIVSFVVVWLLCVTFIVLFYGTAQATNSRNLYVSIDDRAVFDRYVEQMKSKQSLSMNELMVCSAQFFLGTPYVASTLEKEPEGLVVNLRELDCTTFAETVLALSRTMQEANPSFEKYCDHLQYLRYRNGEIHDYTDRLHYMADWFYENERKGIVKDVAKEIGGDPLLLNLSFISTHPDSYKQLKGHPELTEKMAAKEKEINARPHYFVPKEKIDQLGKGIKSGDIICFVTTVKGLDVTHVGIAYWNKGELTFFHASASKSAMKVIVQPTSLKEYMNGMKSCRGVIVARPLAVH